MTFKKTIKHRRNRTGPDECIYSLNSGIDPTASVLWFISEMPNRADDRPPMFRSKNRDEWLEDKSSGVIAGPDTQLKVIRPGTYRVRAVVL